MSLIFAGISFGLAGLTYLFQRQNERQAEALSRVTLLSLEDLRAVLQASEPQADLTRRTPYVAVQGRVTCESPLVPPHEGRTQVAYYRTETIEHRSSWNNKRQAWEDVKSVLNQSTGHAPFSLCGTSSQGEKICVTIGVGEQVVIPAFPLYDRFEPQATIGAVASMVDWAKGEKVKGYQIIERGLPVNTLLLAVADFVLTENGEIKARVPLAGQEFILTTASLDSLVADKLHWRGVQRFFKFMFIAMGTAAVAYEVYKYWRKLEDDKERKASILQARQELSPKPASTTVTTPTVGSPDNGQCVICMSNPLNCVILECGHVCTCRDCAEILQARGDRCPMCRAQIDRIANIYVS